MNAPLKIGLASVLALATASPAFAIPGAYRPTAARTTSATSNAISPTAAAYDASRGRPTHSRRNYAARRRLRAPPGRLGSAPGRDL